MKAQHRVLVHTPEAIDAWEQRIAAIKDAQSLTDDIGLVLAAKLRVTTLVSQLRLTLAAIG